MPPRLDLVGQTFGRWTVVSSAGIDPGSRGSIYNCRCDCGAERTVRSHMLRSGRSQSCGCRHREIVGNTHRKHGHASGYKQTPEHAVWQAMLRRCLTPTHKHYADYGGRGITVCERWKPENNGFLNFLADMGSRPEPKLTIERRENSLGYCKDNCYWAPWVHQANNKRSNHRLTFNGETKTVTAWAKSLDLKPRTLFTRLADGWSIERALTTPATLGGWGAARKRKS